MSDDGKKPTTVRLKESTKVLLDRASYVLDRSQSAIIDEALGEFFQKHNLLKRYQLNIRTGHVVLTSIDAGEVHIEDVRQLNGVPPSEIAKEYSRKYGQPVQVIEEK